MPTGEEELRLPPSPGELPRPRPILLREDALVILDQTALPLVERYLELRTPQEVHRAIRELKVRGAPAIGIAAAYGLYLGLRGWIGETAPGGQEVPFPGQGPASDRQPGRADEVLARAEAIAAFLRTARPTAVNPAWALDQVLGAMRQAATEAAAAGPAGGDAVDRDPAVRALVAAARRRAEELLAEDDAVCLAIGRYGLELLRQRLQPRLHHQPGATGEGRPRPLGVLTHCNAGGLATAGWGTALAVIYLAHAAGLPVHVYADETRPVLQGARLTAWELQQAGVPVTLICDNMAAALMAQSKVDVVIVGADRVAANGDVANKIGTYGVAVLARHHDIPFYVAAPTSSIDLSLPNGAAIPIEERSPEEVTTIQGHPIAPPGIDVWNPAFDVTPAELVSAFITEHGVVYPPFPGGLQKVVAAAGSGPARLRP
ncbi:MAG TPA: S-methyl-5-thioribose-1-phosphate isomerase [Firmicutes bacterium]|nr:S-methyl-5-thioribose-1-phosphate isomerase [Bacillota bacterium]